jgi:hypothetical protein
MTLIKLYLVQFLNLIIKNQIIEVDFLQGQERQDTLFQVMFYLIDIENLTF